MPSLHLVALEVHSGFSIVDATLPGSAENQRFRDSRFKDFKIQDSKISLGTKVETLMSQCMWMPASQIPIRC